MKEWKNVYWLFKTKSILFRFLFRCFVVKQQTCKPSFSSSQYLLKIINAWFTVVLTILYQLILFLPSVSSASWSINIIFILFIHSLHWIELNALALASQCTDVMFWCVKAFIGDRISFISKTDYRIHLNKLIHKLEWIFTQIIRFYKRFKNLIRKKDAWYVMIKQWWRWRIWFWKIFFFNKKISFFHLLIYIYTYYLTVRLLIFQLLLLLLFKTFKWFFIFLSSSFFLSFPSLRFYNLKNFAFNLTNQSSLL